MKLDKKHLEFVSFAENDLRAKEEAKRIPFSKKIEWTIRLREYAYGKKPLPEGFAEFIRLLNSEKVEYIILGGWAVNLYADPRATADIEAAISLGLERCPETSYRVVVVFFGNAFPDGLHITRVPFVR